MIPNNDILEGPPRLQATEKKLLMASVKQSTMSGSEGKLSLSTSRIRAVTKNGKSAHFVYLKMLW